MYIGIDLGTSSVKVVLVDDEQTIIGQASAEMAESYPQPLWSEQDPADWWSATNAAMAVLKANHGKELGGVRGIGLSGQMHGATLLDDADRVLRPSILWNDGRSAAQCADLERRVPASRDITGNLAVPGFTAPKVMWVAEHEPDVFKKTAKVLLPKDELRLRMTGETVSEMSDASGTLWLDVAARDWSDEMLAACDLSRAAMPALVEGSDPSGTVLPDVAAQWGLSDGVIVAGGAGDQAAGAVGVGTVVPGRAFLSLGTSAVYFVAGETYAPNPAKAVHAFCHCLPDTWHQMAVMLSGGSAFGWVTKATGSDDEAALMTEIEAAGDDAPGVPLFLPYLTGERTPLNDPHATGVFFGMTKQTDRAALGRAVLEGVAFNCAECGDALAEAGANVDMVSVISGGARSRLWGRILAAALDRPMTYHTGGDVGAAFGAARLGRLAVTGESAAEICTLPPIDTEVAPEPALQEQVLERMARWRRLYPALKNEFSPAS